jgi:hypothetical protein
MELLKSKIKDIIYKVAPNGKLIAILVLRERPELFDREENAMKSAVMLDNATTVTKRGLHIGSKIQINLEDIGNPIHKVLNSSHIKPLPTKCPSCNEKLTRNYPEKGGICTHINCTNIFCYGQSQSHLFRLLAYMFPDKDIHILRKFLDEYVTVGNSTTDIRNITDFEKIYLQIKGRKTRTRLNNWIKVHGEFLGDKLFEIDISIEEMLSEPTASKYLFWLTANLPIPKEGFLLIQDINPKMFLAGRDETFKKLTHSQQNYLMDNMDFILKLLNIFKFYGGEKEWK